jgi:hypothetical protein
MPLTSVTIRRGYHNLRLDWRIGSKADDSKRELNFYLGVDNVHQPPAAVRHHRDRCGSAIYNIVAATITPASVLASNQ